MNIEELEQIIWLEPWYCISSNSSSLGEAELQREITTDHVLYRVKVKAVAKRADCDDYLFFLSDNSFPLAVVHLTYQKENTAKFPHTIFYSSLNDWIEQDMKVNNLNYDNE